MPLPYTSRELSERIEIDVQKRPNRFRRRTWWASLWLCVLTVVWIGYRGAEGDHHIYEGGDVATVHRMFENDCAKCHVENWTTLDRILKADFSSHVYSVENSACLKCHAGSMHYPSQHPEEQEPSCADCHHDHQGDVDLKRLSDRHCVNCHQSDLEVFHADTGETTRAVDFPEPVTTFADHPEFAALKLKKGQDVSGFLKDQTPSEASTRHASRQLIEWGRKFVRNESGITEEEAWIDRSGIIFNHAKHMKVYREGDDEDAEYVWEIDSYRSDKASPRRFRNINQLCAECHQEAPDGRYILPIVYEEHCQSCHGLYYNGGVDDQLPHDDPSIVQGYLTSRLTVAILNESDADKVARNIGREVPGRRAPLRASQAAELKKRLRSTMQDAMLTLDRVDPVPDNERKTLRAVHSVLGSEAKGGCAYCHTVRQKTASDDSRAGGWTI
ncbi:MAG: hypothetical protein VB858_16915, partial [Planctomycetaceae bacterium]